ncbi:hypothetical protein MBANPS3_012525, partial [Mucor bainieri]
MDLDNPLSPSDHPTVLPGDVNLSQRLDNLKVVIDTQLAEAELIGNFLIVERNDQARQTAVNRLSQLNQSAAHLLSLRDRLAQSLAADSARASATAPVAMAPVAPAPVVQPPAINSWPVLLPYFQWVGMEIFAPEQKPFPTVDACLQKFEDVMFGHEMPFDIWFKRLVPPMLSPEQRSWYDGLMKDAKQAPTTWDAFKDAVKARYGESVLVEQRRCATEIISGKFKPNETILNFIDRFNELRRNAKNEVPPDFLVLNGFLDAIPPVLKDKVNTIRQGRRLMTSTDVDIVIDITREAIQSMSAEEVSAITASSKSPGASFVKRTAAGSNASQWASAAASSSAVTAPHARATHAGRVSKQPAKGAKKQCKFHEGTLHNHATEECKRFLQMVRENPSSGSANATPVAAKGQGGRFMLSLADAKEQDRCRVCGGHNYSAGHECNSAVRTGNPPMSTLHKFSMLRLQDAETRSPVSAATTKSCALHGESTTHDTSECQELLRLRAKKVRSRTPAVSPAEASPTPAAGQPAPVAAAPLSPVAVGSRDDRPAPTTASEPMDVDEHIAFHAQECKDNQSSSLPVHKSNSLLIPLVVESRKVYGVLDTGCTFSICSPRFARQLGVQINPVAHGHVQLGHTDSVQPRVGTCSLQISYNKRSFIHTFEIFDFFTDSDNCPMLLGLDIMPDLQIGVTGLASTWFEELGPRLPDPVDPDIEPNNDPYGSLAEREKAFKPIEQLLKDNAAIDLATTHCNLPGAIVQLETIP